MVSPHASRARFRKFSKLCAPKAILRQSFMRLFNPSVAPLLLWYFHAFSMPGRCFLMLSAAFRISGSPHEM